MYLIKSGSIRLFTKKGGTSVEIDTIRSGQILGELAFLDGNPRSLSGEALGDCDVVEISGPAFLDVLSKAPEWLKILLKTVVGRLRTANTRLRQLESANTTLNYSDTGKRTNFQFLSLIEFSKACSTVILEAIQSNSPSPEGVVVSLDTMGYYANNVFGLPISKMECSLDILQEIAIAKRFEEKGVPKAKIQDLKTIDSIIRIMIEENKLEQSRRHEPTVRSHNIMQFIAQTLPKFTPDPKTGVSTINLIEVKKFADTNTGREAFKLDELSELIRMEFITSPKTFSAEVVTTTLKPDLFMSQIKYIKTIYAIKALNEQKRTT